MKNQMTVPRPAGRAVACLLVAFGMGLAMSISVAPCAQAQSNDALKILKAMNDYVASQKTFSLKYDSDTEALTPELQKIQFASSGQVQVSRPDKLRAIRTGGYIRWLHCAGTAASTIT